jgi:hypothetical protein
MAVCSFDGRQVQFYRFHYCPTQIWLSALCVGFDNPFLHHTKLLIYEEWLLILKLHCKYRLIYRCVDFRNSNYPGSGSVQSHQHRFRFDPLSC